MTGITKRISTGISRLRNMNPKLGHVKNATKIHHPTETPNSGYIQPSGSNKMDFTDEQKNELQSKSVAALQSAMNSGGSKTTEWLHNAKKMLQELCPQSDRNSSSDRSHDALEEKEEDTPPSSPVSQQRNSASDVEVLPLTEGHISSMQNRNLVLPLDLMQQAAQAAKRTGDPSDAGTIGFAELSKLETMAREVDPQREADLARRDTAMKAWKEYGFIE